jgi:ubiquinone/menaquinone biosynthesis C-methylase UbiE
MSIYQEKVLPYLVDLVCSSKSASKQRKKVVPYAEGEVLEVGVGSGLNFPFYDVQKITKIWALETSKGMQVLAKKAPRDPCLNIEFITLSSEELPFDEASIDTIVITYVLCTIPDVRIALQQMFKVLKPGGKLLFSEHGRAPDANIKFLQNLVNPFWRRVAGGCNLNRHIPNLLKEAGFILQKDERMYLPGFRFFSYNYWGTAVKS